ncbi:MAG: electron transfer flavoprotein subunit alpha/FixB family protein [Syntrophobacteraceae bacterium]
MGKCVCVVAEFRAGSFRRVSYEVASEGRRIADALGASLCAVAVGSGVAQKAAELGQYGVDTVYVADDPSLENYVAETYTPVVADIIGKCDPGVVLLAASVDGKDLSSRLAARLNTALAQDCTKISCEGGAVKATRPIFAGKCLALCEWAEGALPVISIRPNVFDCLPPQQDKAAAVEKVAVSAPAAKSRAVSVDMDTSGKVELTEADIIVAGGRGLKSAENYALLEDLAKVLGAAVGASRAAVDSGWRPHADQVGQTGKVVNPNLYIAVGVSGAIQHLAGMGSSKFIVAINKDPEAPIFSKADYGIVEDLFDFMPVFTEEVRTLKSAS